jgi:divalent metal cation (Fe/Co/Zn/Cd) transporter
MSEEKKFFSTFAGGAVIGVSIFAFLFFALEKTNHLFSSEENINPLSLPKLHLFALVVNIILFRFFIKKEGKENTAKGILFVSFLYMLVYFIFINK